MFASEFSVFTTASGISDIDMEIFPSNGNFVCISSFLKPPSAVVLYSPPANIFIKSPSSLCMKRYSPRELNVLAILGGQHAQPNHFCRTGFTWFLSVAGIQLSGHTSSGLT